MRFSKDIKILLFFAKDYKRYILGIFVLSFLYAAFEGLNIAVLFPIINSVIKADIAAVEGGSIVRLLNVLIKFMPARDAFISACIFVIMVVVLKNIFRYLYLVLNGYTSYKIWDDVQKKLFVKYITADYAYFLNHKQGEIVYRLYTAPAGTGGVLQIIPQIVTEFLKILFIVTVLLSISFPATLGVGVIAGLFYFFTRGISRKISYLLGKGRVETSEQQNILISEMINGIKMIKVFLSEKKWINGFYKATDGYFKLSRKDTLWVNMPTAALEIFALTSLSIFLIFIRKFYPQSLVLNLPLLGVFAYAFQRMMPSLGLITNLKMQTMGGLPVLETLRSVIDEKMSYLTDGTKIIDSFNEGIEFRNVSFSYPGRPKTLKGISISFQKNTCTAIVGPSGSGKTTMVNLLIRLFDPTEGGIFIDGIDLREIKRNSWLSEVGFVSQDTFIFHASVRDNIAFGLDGVCMEDVIKAANIANAHDFIVNLPQGYDTIVGEKGMKLSGGEQQRIAIARAVLRNPQILIFDEATSALDNVSQSLIQNAINKIVKDHTVILIAHRLSTIVNADIIVVLENGEIEEMGNHQELIAKKGFYWQLYNNEKELVSVNN